jgi:hypothetical protein
MKMDDDYLDLKWYWADPDRNIRRMSGEQDIVDKATDACSKAEWAMVLDGIIRTFERDRRRP